MLGSPGDVVDWDVLFKREENEKIVQLRGVPKRDFVLSCEELLSKHSIIEKVAAEEREASGQFWRNLPEDPDCLNIQRPGRSPLRWEDRNLWSCLDEQARPRIHQIRLFSK